MLNEIKEKLSKEKAVETFDSIYTDKAYKFTVKINESEIMKYLFHVVEDHNKKNPEKEIEASDVVKIIVEKALLENATFYKYDKTYNDLEAETMAVRLANTKLYYFDNFTAEYSKENEKLKSELDSIKKIVNHE